MSQGLKQRDGLLEERVKMQRDMAVARKIQMDVLPKELPPCPGYDMAAYSLPAEQTGGDIYDLVAVALDPANPGDAPSLVLLLADATGHGIGPALSVTQVRAMLRMAVRLGANLDDAFRHINDQLSDDLSSNRFVTAFLGVLETASHRLTYHAGGQGPILHFHAARAESTLEVATTLPMGMMPIITPTDPRVALMEPGDIVAAITDGIYEYENGAGKMFGDQRVVELVREEAGSTAERILHRIVDEVTAFASGAPQNDDMTLLIVKRGQVSH
jgi:phosphoserine phosphatase